MHGLYGKWPNVAPWNATCVVYLFPGRKIALGKWAAYVFKALTQNLGLKPIAYWSMTFQHEVYLQELFFV